MNAEQGILNVKFSNSLQHLIFLVQYSTFPTPIYYLDSYILLQ